MCPIHGSFFQKPVDHLRGKGCWLCGCDSRKGTTLSFIEDAKKIHGEKYDYSKVVYINNREKVLIICLNHGEFYQKAYVHLQGAGCPQCSSSNGEKLISEYLQEHSIIFERQKRFVHCKFKRSLIFDFYVPKYTLFIEYQGEQHYRKIAFFHKTDNIFYECQEKDRIKKLFAKSQGIFLEITYLDNIRYKLDKFFNEGVI